MDKICNLLSHTEPSDGQLQGLMKAVLQDVKNLAKVAEEKLANTQQQQIKEALERYKQRYEQK